MYGFFNRRKLTFYLDIIANADRLRKFLKNEIGARFMKEHWRYIYQSPLLLVSYETVKPTQSIIMTIRCGTALAKFVAVSSFHIAFS